MPSALLIIAPQGYQDQEYAGTRGGLTKAGYAITVASTAVGPCVGKFGGMEEATIALKDVTVSPFAVIAFIGGPGAAALAEDTDAQRVARDAVAWKKVLGAICIAPLILARAGVLRGKQATVWDQGGEQESTLRAEGAVYTGENVTVDGRIVTANGPAAAEKFGQTLARL